MDAQTRISYSGQGITRAALDAGERRVTNALDDARVQFSMVVL